MSIGSALSIGKMGVLAHQDYLSAIGQNIANVNTTGYKGQRVEFSNMISQVLSNAKEPTGNRGGINPLERGLGATISSVFRNFAQGNIEASDIESDLGLDGKGFFAVAPLESENTAPASSEWLFTRDGSMELGMMQDGSGALVQTLLHKGTGLPLLGQQAVNGVVPVPADGVITTALAPIRIPLGDLMSPTATTEMQLGGNFNALGSIATQGSITTSNLFDTGAAALTAATDLNVVEDASANQLFSGIAAGETIGVTVDIGGKEYTKNFTYGTDGTTISDLGTFINDNYLNQAAGDGANVAFVGNQIQITGNHGARNDIADITLSYSGNRYHPFTSSQKADGESSRITIQPVDSLGQRHDVDITFVKTSTTTNNGQSWRWYANSVDDVSGGLSVGTGTFSFDNNGQFTTQSVSPISIDLASGATNPFAFNLTFNEPTNLANEIGTTAEIVNDNGIESGTLTDYAVNQNGLVVGIYSNGENVDLARVAVATFMNDAGLLNEGNNLYKQSANTGDLVLRVGGSGNAGVVRQFALENSNVDLAVSLTRMIEAQRAFQANTRTISTDDEMIQEALSILR